MAKKVPAVKKPEADSTKNLIDAIVTVKHLQDFVRQHGGVEKAMDAVARVRQMVTLTGGFDQLQQALEIVGKEPDAPQA